EALDALWHAERGTPVMGTRGWKDLTGIIDWVVDNWDQPEEGIWETRGGRQKFVYGRMMCWAALDRGIRMAQETGTRPAPLDKWIEARDAINQQIVTLGWNEKKQAL